MMSYTKLIKLFDFSRSPIFYSENKNDGKGGHFWDTWYNNKKLSYRWQTARRV